MASEHIDVNETLKQICIDYTSKNLDGPAPSLDSLAEDYGIPVEMIQARAGSESWVIMRNDAKENYRGSLRKARQEIVNKEVISAVDTMAQMMRERISFVVDMTPKLNAQLFAMIDEVDDNGKSVLKFADLIKLKELLNKEKIDLHKTLAEFQERLDKAESQQTVDEWNEKMKLLLAMVRKNEDNQTILANKMDEDPLFAKLDREAANGR